MASAPQAIGALEVLPLPVWSTPNRLRALQIDPPARETKLPCIVALASAK
jgi:hypothetical protein